MQFRCDLCRGAVNARVRVGDHTITHYVARCRQCGRELMGRFNALHSVLMCLTLVVPFILLILGYDVMRPEPTGAVLTLVLAFVAASFVAGYRLAYLGIRAYLRSAFRRRGHDANPFVRRAG